MALPPPFLPIEGLANFRDLTGQPLALPARPGASLRRGLVYRAAEPSRLTPAGITALQDLRIATVFDLRSGVEITRHGASVRTWEPARRVPVPIFRDEDYSPEAIGVRFASYASPDGTAGFVEAYRTILEAGGEPFSKVLKALAVPEPEPLLVHCTAGKDRTGVVCALILALCGVDDEDIAREYALTELGLAEIREPMVESIMKSFKLVEDREGALRMIGARPESMLASLEMLRREYGSAEEYVMKQCGLSADDIAQIRKNLIVEAE